MPVFTPDPGVIVPANRKARRQMAKARSACSRCGRQINKGEEACWDSGKGSHLRCSRRRNDLIAQVQVQSESEDRRKDLGLVVPERDHLWTPPTSESQKTETLDLSKGVLLTAKS